MTSITEVHERPRAAKIAIAKESMTRFVEVVDSTDRAGLNILLVELTELIEDCSDKQEEVLLQAAITYIEYVKTINKS